MATAMPSKAEADKVARKAEESRRKDVTEKDVAQEALDLLAEIDARHGSSSEVFTDPDVGGYSLEWVLKPALAELRRIKSELGTKPKKDVSSAMLDVGAVQAKFSIPDYVEPEPELVIELVE